MSIFTSAWVQCIPQEQKRQVVQLHCLPFLRYFRENNGNF